MLRITTSPGKSRRTAFRLEGRLTSAELDVLDACIGARRPARIALDLGELRWVDAAGLARLSALIAAGARVAACSPYVDQLLTEELR